jgi:hypothetical protein
VITICLLAFVGLLLLGSIAAFFLCFPIFPAVLVAVILLGMALLFLLGCWAGSRWALGPGASGDGSGQPQHIRVTAESDIWLGAKDDSQLDAIPVSDHAIAVIELSTCALDQGE